MLRSFVMKFRQLIVFSVISGCAISAQAAFVVGMSPVEIRAGIAAGQAAGGDVAAVAVQPLAPPSTPLAAPTTQTPCSVSCS
jgi:TRAP-type C4-dicarboxylate transport system permease large subunit